MAGMDVSTGFTLHPDTARARKRDRDDPNGDHDVLHERSSSRRRDLDELGDAKSATLNHKLEAQRKIASGERVKTPIKMRKEKRFCHQCKKSRVWRDLSCINCGHEECIACWVGLVNNV